MSGPNPPRINTQDVHGQDVVSESSDDHFSSASEGTPNPNRLSTEIPITRVERVDDSAAHGEVPGTPAYEMRIQDAVPDEIEIVPEGRRSRSATVSRSRSASHLSLDSRPQTPGGSPIPKTVVERVDDKPSYGEVEGTLAKEQRMADAAPDEIRRASPVAVDGSGQNIGRPAEKGQDIEQDPDDRQAWFRSMWEGGAQEVPMAQDEVANDADDDENDGNEDDDDFGDDFGDDFVEGGGDEDFGDFDEATPQPAAAPQAPPVALNESILAGLPPLDLKVDLSGSDLQDAITPYLDAIFPDSSAPPSSLPPLDVANSSPFLSDRSLSLWQQLVSPPPMQPPDWTRSRIRRLFLVSLGVPVDLDEILPPSKQKRLVLPNINLSTSPRASTNALDRLRQGDANDSSTSVDSKTGAPRRSKQRSATKGPPPPPEFDANAAMLTCNTTEEAMLGFTDAELREHVASLETLNQRASAVLEHWLHRKDDALKEKEALEGVIENLVGFVKGRRGK